MAKRMEIYKCELCGNIVEVMEGGAGNLVCCAQDMKHFEENGVDAAVEKHVPVIEKIEGGFRVTVGEVEHPMTENHYIQWIEVIADNRVYRKFLTPEDKPVAEFKIDAENIKAREYCNLHGLWKKEI